MYICDYSPTDADVGSQLSFATVQGRVVPAVVEALVTVTTVANDIFFDKKKRNCDSLQGLQCIKFINKKLIATV